MSVDVTDPTNLYKRDYDIMKWNLTHVGSCQKKPSAGFFLPFFLPKHLLVTDESHMLKKKKNVVHGVLIFM